MQLCCTIRKVQLLTCIAAGAAILTVLIVLFLYNYPTFARHRVIDALVFRNGTAAMDRFTNTSDLENLRIEVRFFNVTNVDGVLGKTEKINLQEIGPFVYHEYKYKEFLENDQTNGRITYKLRTRYTFLPEKSAGLANSTYITWPNVPVLALEAFLETVPLKSLVYNIVNELIGSVKEPPFITDTVDNFLFKGSERELFKRLEKLDVLNIVKPWPLPENRFGLLYGRNDTWDPVKGHTFTVATGFSSNSTDYRSLNRYLAMNQSAILPYWNKPPSNCNIINGTDGQFFSPFLDKDDQLQVFSADICRKMDLKFKQVTSISGLPVWKYTLDERSFQAPSKNSDNRCYCMSATSLSDKECQTDGLIDLSTCVAKNILASGAHFMYGDPQLLTRITGVTPPSASSHEPTIYIEPNTGLATNVKVPLQLNVRLVKNKFKIFQWFEDVDPLILPLVTITEMAELTDDQSSLLRSKLLLLDSWFVIMVLGGTIIFIVAIIVIATFLCIKFRTPRETIPPPQPRETDPLIGQSSRQHTRRRSLPSKSTKQVTAYRSL